jgi:hypothetical protein
MKCDALFANRSCIKRRSPLSCSSHVGTPRRPGRDCLQCGDDRGLDRFRSHWSVQQVSGRVGALHLNNWTGEIVWCAFSANAPPSNLDCRADEWAAFPPKQ